MSEEINNAQEQNVQNSANDQNEQKPQQEQKTKLTKEQKAEAAKQAKLKKAEEKKNKKQKKVEAKAENSELIQRTDEVNELFKTPPAGVYPKTDSQGRVIKYKKRGGVFAFFVGIFFSLFLFVFCGGLVASYFYYCYDLEKLGKVVGIDLSKYGDASTKTANDLVNFFKDDYVNVTVEKAEKSLGLNVKKIVEQNLGLEINDFYSIQISMNGEEAKPIGQVMLKDIFSNTQSFLNALLPELYKRVELSSLLKMANIELKLDKSLVKDELFDVNPNPTFKLGDTTYTINFSNKIVTTENEQTFKIEDQKFTIGDVVYSISDDKTKLTSTNGEITLKYNHTYKKLENLTVDEVINTVIPNYVGGEKLTLGFIQDALNLDLIDKDNPEFETLLSTSINDLKIDKVIDSVSLRSFEKLLGIDVIPLNDESGKYDDLLNEKIGQVSFDNIKKDLSIGALLDLLKVELPNFPVLKDETNPNYQTFRNAKLENFTQEIEKLTVRDFVDNITKEVHPYDYFVMSDENYYINKDEAKVFNKINLAPAAISSMNEQTTYQYEINHVNYLLYDNYAYKQTNDGVKSFVILNSKRYDYDQANHKFIDKSTTPATEFVITTSNQVVIDGTTYTFLPATRELEYNSTKYNIVSNITLNGTLYTYDIVNQKLINTETSEETAITNSTFSISNGSTLKMFGTIDNTRAIYYFQKEESRVASGMFDLNFDADEMFEDDVTIRFRIDKDKNLSYLKPIAKIESNKFTIGTVEYTIGENSVTGSDLSSFDISTKSPTTEIALYAVSDLTIKNIIDGDLKNLIGNDATDETKLNNLLLSDVLNKEFTGLLKNLNGVTVGEVLHEPSVLIDSITCLPLSEVMGIDDSSSPLLKAIADADLTINSLLEDTGTTNPIIDAMGNVTFFDLGVKNGPAYLIKNNQTTIDNVVYTYNETENRFENGSNNYAITDGKVTIGTTVYRFITDSVIGPRLVKNEGYNPLIAKLETIKINDVLEENGLYDKIKVIKLSEMSESSSGIMKILGDITFEDFGEADVITNKLKASKANLADLLDQTIYFYDYFAKDDITYYIVYTSVPSGELYTTANKHEINHTTNEFEYNLQTYTILSSSNRIMKGGEWAANITEDNTFVLDGKLFIISGNYVYELTKDTTHSFIVNSSHTKVTKFDEATVDIDITKSSLNKAVLSLTVGDLFNGSFTTSLTNQVKNIQLSEILGDVSSNKLLNALITKNPDVTVSTLGSTINDLTMGEVFLDSNFNTGILSLIKDGSTPLQDVKLVNVASVISSFDFGDVKMGDLVAQGVVDFGTNNSQFVQYDSGTGEIKYTSPGVYDSTYGNYTFVDFVNFILDH